MPITTHTAPSPTDVSREGVVARRLFAAAMRDQGATYEEIAEAIGRTVGATRGAVRAGRRLAGNVTQRAWMLRRFGVEVEHNGLSQRQGAIALQNAGLRAEHQDYNHRVIDFWKVVPDGSCGSEAVSPPLSGQNGFNELATAMQALSASGAAVNRNCGMHVHVDMDGMSGDQIADLITAYVTFQDEIDGLVAPSRRGSMNGYCRRWNQTGDRYNGVSEFERVVAEFRASRSITTGYDRYRTINVMSFPKYGTIEFRQHQGTLAPKKAEAWITLLLGLVEVARLGRTADLVHGDGFIESVATITGMERRAVRAIARRRDGFRRSTVSA